jgi:MFS transporter, putative metabolite:H+ symporter
MAVESIQICILTCILPSWLGNAGAQTGVYGLTLWAPSLFVLLLKVTPQEAAKMMILLSVSGFIDRLSFSFFSELMGRRNAGGLLGFGAGLSTIIAGYNYDATFAGVSAFWLLLGITFFFADGGFAIVGPYAAEVWPSHLKTFGMGSAYGFGDIGKIIGPVGLALIVSSGNYLKPDVIANTDGLGLSRLLVSDDRDCVLFLRNRDER